LERATEGHRPELCRTHARARRALLLSPGNARRGRSRTRARGFLLRTTTALLRGRRRQAADVWTDAVDEVDSKLPTLAHRAAHTPPTDHRSRLLGPPSRAATSHRDGYTEPEAQRAAGPPTLGQGRQAAARWVTLSAVASERSERQATGTPAKGSPAGAAGGGPGRSLSRCFRLEIAPKEKRGNKTPV